jgi:hypothetical protein
MSSDIVRLRAPMTATRRRYWRSPRAWSPSARISAETRLEETEVAVDERDFDRRTAQLREHLQAAETSAGDDGLMVLGPEGAGSAHYSARALFRRGAPPSAR